MMGGFTDVAGTVVTDTIASTDRRGVILAEYKLSVARAYALALANNERMIVAGGLNKYPANIDIFPITVWQRCATGCYRCFPPHATGRKHWRMVCCRQTDESSARRDVRRLSRRRRWRSGAARWRALERRQRAQQRCGDSRRQRRGAGRGDAARHAALRLCGRDSGRSARGLYHWRPRQDVGLGTGATAGVGRAHHRQSSGDLHGVAGRRAFT